MKTFFALLALPWIYLWMIIMCGFGVFRSNGGHTSGIATGLLILGLIPAIVIGVMEIGAIATILIVVYLFT